MSLKTTTKVYPIAPKGIHLAICTKLIDLGLQKGIFKNPETGEMEEKVQPKIQFTWELCNKKYVFSEEKGEEPFVVSRDYTFSFTKNSNLFKMLKCWYPDIEKNKNNFKIQDMLGKPCMLQIVHNPNKQDPSIIYANVENVMEIDEDTKVPKQYNPTVIFDIDDWNEDIFNTFPDFIKKKIMSSEEVKNKNSFPQDFNDNHIEDIPFID